MTGGHHHGEGVTYEGLTMYKPSKWHVNGGKAFCGLMWFWIFYRFYHDYEGFVVRCFTLITASCDAQA